MRILSILASTLLLTSCIFDAERPRPQEPEEWPEGSVAEISFMADMPGPGVMATRSIGSVAENLVEDIHILAFEKTGTEKLVYKAKAKGLAVSTDPDVVKGNRVKFKATLPVGTAYNFMILANVGDMLSGITISGSTPSTRADVLKLTKSLTTGTKWSVDQEEETMDKIPMWGEIRDDQPLTASSTPTFKLTRMLARVNVLYRPESTTATSDFRLTSIRVYNTSTVGAVAPAFANWDTDDEIITGATQPYGSDGYGIPDYENPVPLVYTGDDIIDFDTCQDLIYLFETPHNQSTYMSPANNSNWINNPCLVIGGKYSPDGTSWPAKDTYYRVDFIKKTTNQQSEPVDEWLSVLRNFSYNITITEVINDGYETPEIALKSAPLNMKANILPWNESNMNKVIFDGVFYLSVSKDSFLFPRLGTMTKDTARETNVVRIKTDYLVGSDRTDPESGWHVDRIVVADTNTPIDWDLALVPMGKPSGWKPDDVNEAYFTFGDNPGPTDRKADVWIKAGRLEYKIRVVQKIMSLDVLDMGNNDLPEETMTFILPDAGTNGMETRPFKVMWTPAGQPVTITGRNMANAAFEPEWITGGPAFPAPLPFGSTNTPAEGEIPSQLSAVGEQNFVVQPVAVTAQELIDDPFYETNTTYYFAVKNLGETLIDSVSMRQIHYDIKGETIKYRLDGGTHTVTVRSNANWEIVSIEEHLYGSQTPTPRPLDGTPIMIDFRYAYDNLKEGLHFGPNVNGTALAFHLVWNEGGDHKGKWGHAWITLKMTTPQGAEKLERVLLQFPPPSKLLMGIGYHDMTYATNPAYPTHWHNNSAFNMLSSPYNFGSMDESIYNVDGFRIIGHNAQGKPTNSSTGEHADREWHPNSMKNWLNHDRPDVIVTADYDADGFTAQYTENEMQLLKQYVDNGGALIFMNHGGGGTAQMPIPTRFLEIMLDKPAGSLNYSATGANAHLRNTGYRKNTLGRAYPLADVDDPVLKGPFGDVRGLEWGVHFNLVGIKTSELGPDIVSLSNGPGQTLLSSINNDDDYTLIFRHKTKNFIFIGCGGFVACSYPSWQQDDYPQYAPFYCDQTFFRPAARTNWGSSKTAPKTEVQNSIVFANAVAWALTVTNHTPPEEGYKNINE